MADKKFRCHFGRLKAERVAVIDVPEEAISETALEMKNHFIHRILEITRPPVKHCKKQH